MLEPTYDNLRRHAPVDGPGLIFASGSTGPSGSPRFYKYVWQVFSLDSQHEGEAFRQHAPWLSNTRFQAEIMRLHVRGLPCLVYGWRLPRKDPANPWNLNSARWHGVVFAPSWDDDTDPVIEGGHK